MRNVILTLLLSICFFCAKAQAPYYAFPDSNAEWKVQSRYILPGSSTNTTATFYFVEDEVIKGITYHHLVANGNNYAGYLRSDTLKRTYFFTNVDADTVERIMYDFSLSVGDTFRSFIYPFDGIVVTDTLSVTLNNSTRKVWVFDNNSLYWIEGIGDTRGLFPYLLTSEYNWYQALCWFKQNNFLETYCIPFPGFTSCWHCGFFSDLPEINTLHVNLFPNPVSNICKLQVSSGTTKTSASLFDIAGRETIPLFTNQNITEFTFNTTAITPGIYLVKVTDEQGRTATQKLIKE